MAEEFDPDRQEKFREPAPDPRADYATPADVLADPALNVDDMRALLLAWANEVDDRLKAEEEGMSASDPMRASEEAALAKEAEKVACALLELDSCS